MTDVPAMVFGERLERSTFALYCCQHRLLQRFHWKLDITDSHLVFDLWLGTRIEMFSGTCADRLQAEGGCGTQPPDHTLDQYVC